jgi:hypothetical protein
MQAQTGNRSTALLIPNLGDRQGWVVNATPRPPYTRKRATVPILQEVTAMYTTSIINKEIRVELGNSSFLLNKVLPYVSIKKHGKAIPLQAWTDP